MILDYCRVSSEVRRLSASKCDSRPQRFCGFAYFFLVRRKHGLRVNLFQPT